MIKKDGCFDVVIIGAGPAGALASSLLAQKGYQVLILEKQHFPRFSIGESLLPQSMEFLEAANMIKPVIESGFQHKNGAAFSKGDQYDFFDFRNKFTAGWGTTYQVQRATFDKTLADCAASHGVEIRYGHSVTEFLDKGDTAQLTIAETDNNYTVEAKFVLDASGFGRVLPKLLDLESPPNLSPRVSFFTHVEDKIQHPEFDRNKILISVSPNNNEVWYWLIPFSNGRSSIGVVIPRALYDAQQSNQNVLTHYIAQTSFMNELLTHNEMDTDVGKIDGYSCDVTQLYGKHYALLGNAGEFLDPIFSSGVTIALKSATLAADTLDRQLQGHTVDWHTDYAQPLKKGIDTFRAFVDGWYSGDLQDIIFTEAKSDKIKSMISSILAGYAWDTSNPYVKDPKKLKVLAKLCQNS